MEIVEFICRHLSTSVGSSTRIAPSLFQLSTSHMVVATTSSSTLCLLLTNTLLSFYSGLFFLHGSSSIDGWRNPKSTILGKHGKGFHSPRLQAVALTKGIDSPLVEIRVLPFVVNSWIRSMSKRKRLDFATLEQWIVVRARNHPWPQRRQWWLWNEHVLDPWEWRLE